MEKDKEILVKYSNSKNKYGQNIRDILSSQNKEKTTELYNDINTLVEYNYIVLEDVDIFISEVIKALYDFEKVQDLSGIINVLMNNNNYDEFKKILNRKEHYKTLFIIENVKNKNLQETIKQREMEVEQEIKTLKDENKSQKQQIKDLTQEQNNLKEENESLQQNVKKLDEKCKKMKEIRTEKIPILKKEIEYLTKNNTELQLENETLRQNNIELQRKLYPNSKTCRTTTDIKTSLNSMINILTKMEGLITYVDENITTHNNNTSDFSETEDTHIQNSLNDINKDLENLKTFNETTVIINERKNNIENIQTNAQTTNYSLHNQYGALQEINSDALDMNSAIFPLYN